jgi:hypothetical protein
MEICVLFLSTMTLVLQLLSPVLAADNSPSNSVINLDTARSAFAEARALCSADNGKLWGVSLCGPMLFADAQTREVVANTAFPGSVQHANDLFVGTLPDAIQVSNTSVEFVGIRWTMVSWPLPTNSQSLAVLLLHESYHRIQPQLGLVASGGLGQNGHLDTEQGRIWLRGELHALSVALQTQGGARNQALRDALAMRAYRQMLFTDAAAQERGVELNESLAESTGIDVGLAPAGRIAYAVRDIKNVEDASTYVRA